MTTITYKKPSTLGWIILGALAALTVLGVVTGVYRLFAGLGATTALSDQYAWGLWLGFDFVLIAFGGAAFTLALVVHIFNLEKYHSVLRMALLSGFLSYVSVLIILLIDLGRPDRFWGFIVYPNVHSPLFEISWCILLYTVVLTLEVAPLILERLNRDKLANLLHKLVLPVTIAGITLSTLHQSTLGTLALSLPERVHPLWWSMLLPLLFYLSAIGLGLSATILLALIANRAFGRELAKMDVLAGLAKGSVAVWIVYGVLRFGDLLFTGDMGQVFAFDTSSIMFWVEMLLMVFAPIVLYAMPKVRQSRAGLFWTALAVTAGMFLNRFQILFSGGPVIVGSTHVTASYFPSFIEFAVQFGVLAAAGLAWYLAIRFLPVFTAADAESH
jgi:Ni/Fe-hydrogenase subunit HybB-like protein